MTGDNTLTVIRVGAHSHALAMELASNARQHETFELFINAVDGGPVLGDEAQRHACGDDDHDERGSCSIGRQLPGREA